MKRTSHVRGAAVFALLIAAGVGLVSLQTRVGAQGRGTAQAPKLEVDPLWPQPFPVEKHWAMGSVSGVTVDAQDHIWTVNRGVDSLQGNEKGPTLTPPASQCCYAAPQILEFDATGKLLTSFGGPGNAYQWPQNASGIAVDAKGNVWIAASGVPPAAGRGARGAPPAAAAGAPATAAPPADAAAGGRAGRGGGRGAGAPGAGAGAGGGAAAAGGAPPAGGGAAAGGGGGRGGRGGAAGAAPGGAGAAPAPAAAAPAARGGAPAGPPAPADAHVLEFTGTGQFVKQIGKAGQSEGPDSQTTLSRPAALAIDDAANELYVADTGNRRIVVFDSNTGAYKRHWFGSGEKAAGAAPGPYDPAAAPVKGFREVTCVKIAKDGMVYVCDRGSDRVQVFQKNGTFVKEMVVAKDTKVEGSVWDVSFSADPQQRFLYVADGVSKTIWVLQRDTLAVVSHFGEGGRYPGMFYAVGSVGVDSKGNVYTGENSDGKRVQKWNYKGMGAAQPMN